MYSSRVGMQSVRSSNIGHGVHECELMDVFSLVEERNMEQDSCTWNNL